MQFKNEFQAIKAKLTVQQQRSLIIKGRKLQALIFKPNDGFKSKWDVFVMLLAVINCFTIPFKIAFDPPSLNSQAFQIANNVIDLFFLLDIFVAFRTTHIDDQGNEVTQPCAIAINYLKG